jgi:hypothetical protein
MGGSIENPDRLDDLLTRYPHLYLDSSATKWIVRGVAAQPDRIRALLLKFPDRILFGSDLVVADKFDFDHYASRFWAHQMMWETRYAAESPIDDPDADPPQLRGLDLPARPIAQVLRHQRRTPRILTRIASWGLVVWRTWRARVDRHL